MPLLISPRVLLLVGAILMAIAIGASLVWWAGHDEKAQDKQDVRSAEALVETAQDAAATVIARAEDDASVDELVNEAVKEIKDAQSDEAAGAAARAAICGLPNFSRDPACTVQ